jgi:hypothetical protein
MTKVVAPLGSFSASGKIGKSLVFFSHLGRNVVRGLVTPANPKTTGQGDNRLLLGALGRAARVPLFGGQFLTALKPVIPAGQTWVSAMIRDVRALYSSPTALDTAFDNHTKAAIFQSEAEALGLAPLTISYAGTLKTLPAGAILYALATFADAINAQNPGIFGSSSPWDEPLASWTSADIVAFVSYMTAPVV